jgi:EAL and modified HD-GYP domain-containing signal transduction protein
MAYEQLAGPRPGELFTLGLFSVIDALMDAPIEDVLAKIPFPSDMRNALTERKGEKGALLDCVTTLEAGDFDRAQRLVRGAGDLYVEALMWADEAARALFEEPAAAVAA